jgi:hypothetical protein
LTRIAFSIAAIVSAAVCAIGLLVIPIYFWVLAGSGTDIGADDVAALMLMIAFLILELISAGTGFLSLLTESARAFRWTAVLALLGAAIFAAGVAVSYGVNIRRPGLTELLMAWWLVWSGASALAFVRLRKSPPATG